LDISKQLIDSEEKNSKFLGAFFIHQTLRENIIEIAESKSTFLKYRDLIFLELLEKLKSFNDIVIERICYSISILMAVGIISYWETCIEDVIQYAKISKENCYLVLIIMQNIMKELNELQIAGKKMLRIKDTLIEKLDLISDFVTLLLENFNANKINSIQVNSNSFEAKFLSQTLDLIHSWIKLELNILKNQNILFVLFQCFTIENSEIICDIFSESICLSKSAKKYFNDGEYDVNVLYEKSLQIEIQSIEIICEFLNVFLSENILGNQVSSENPIKKILINNRINFPKFNTEEKLTILSNFANVFGSIFEFYPNLIFMKNTLSTNLLSSLFYFLTHKNKKISSKMFMSFNEIKEFINRGYKLSNYNSVEKKEFCDFLIKICENIMSNCKLSDISIPILSQGKLLTNIDDIEICDPLEDNNNIDTGNDISISEYRKQVEEIFYDIFMVFLSNFEEEGVSYFFIFLFNILENSQINNLTALPNNDQKIFVIEVVLLVVNSIISCFEVTDNYAKYLVEFTKKIVNSQIIQNNKLICPFLKFLDAACPYIYKDEILYNTSVQILMEVLKIKQYENVAGLILLQITEFSKTPSKKNFDYLYSLYIDQYDLFTNYTLGNFVEILANTVGVKEKELDNYENLNYGNNINNQSNNKNEEIERFVKYSSKEISDNLKSILIPAIERIEKTFMILMENLMNVGINIENLNNQNMFLNEFNCGLDINLVENIKMVFLRNFIVYNLIFKKAFFLSGKIMIEMFNEVMHKSGKILDKCLRFFVKDVNFVKEISKIFNKLASNITNEILPYFDFINELMLYLYVNNPDNYYCLNVLKPLYSNACVNSNEKRDYIANNFLELSEIIKKNVIEFNKNNKLEIIVVLSQLWTTVVNSVDKFIIKNESFVYGFFDFILDAFKSVSEPDLNKSIMKLISNLVMLPNIIPKDIVFNRFKEIVFNIYSSLDNLVGGSLPQVNKYYNY